MSGRGPNYTTLYEPSPGGGGGGKSSNSRGRGRGGRGSAGRGGRGRGKAKAPPAHAPSAHSKKSNVVCRHYSRSGSCRLGNKCKFIHDDSSSASLHNNNTSNTTNGGSDVVVTAGEEDIPASGFGNGNDTIMSDTNASGFGLGQQQQQQQKQKATSSSKSEEKKVNPPSHITDRKFANLPNVSKASRRALSEVFKYEYMTTVQAETLPLILEDTDGTKDCLAKAKTGTGKTLAFMIPTIEQILKKSAQSNNYSTNSNNAAVHCLVISPTRELAQQITTETEKLLTFHKSPSMKKVITFVGGTNKNKDLKILQGPCSIVVATPGRLLDHLQNSNLQDRMKSLDVLVLDEADQLLDMGFRPDILRILRFLQPSKNIRQTLLFSATIPDQVNEIAGLALRSDYHFVDTVGEDSGAQTHLHVQQQLMISSQQGGTMIRDLFSILERETTSDEPYKIIVFFTTARLTGFMAELFNSVKSQTGYKVLEIHSRKAQKARERASEAFRSSTNAVMFTSDVTARGMDYPDVTFVLQVGLTDRSQYIHRLGRTARAGKDGKGGLLLADYEAHHMTKRELKDMPLEPMSVPQSSRANFASTQAIQNVSHSEGLTNSAEQAYRAWLGYYNGHLKKVGWDKKQLVQMANAWGSEVGLQEQPTLLKKTVGKMGLKGVPGLRLE